MKRTFFLGQALFLGSAGQCLLASHSKRKLMSLFSAKNSPLLVYCAAETSQLSGLGSLATKGHCLFLLICLVQTFQGRSKLDKCWGGTGPSPPPVLGARRHLQCLVHMDNVERNLRGKCTRPCTASWASVSLNVSVHSTTVSEGWAMAALAQELRCGLAEIFNFLA